VLLIFDPAVALEKFRGFPGVFLTSLDDGDQDYKDTILQDYKNTRLQDHKKIGPLDKFHSFTGVLLATHWG